MVQGWIWKRAAALLAAAGLFAFLVGGISADDGNTEAVAARVLKPTQAIAEVPTEYNELFQIQWGGGSLPQLKGRLADMGCAMNTLWLYDRDRWNGYNRYDLTYDFPTNQQFLQRYDREVPAGMLYATCADQPVGNGLQPTQIIADIPESYDTMFKLQWGGGSLIHFKGRLATMGCIVNNIQFTDTTTNRTYTYNQYNTNSTDQTNQQFLAIFEQFLPAGVFSVDCYDICEFRDKECVSFEEMNERQRGYVSNFERLGFNISIANLPCTNDFNPKVTNQVFPILPLIPNVCIITKQLNDGGGLEGVVPVITINTPQFITIFDDKTPYRNNEEYATIRLKIEIHELCHINQNWQQVRLLRSSQGYYNQYNASYFEHSQYGKEFIDLIGFTSFGSLPFDIIYRYIYSKSPVELSAELCSMYLLDKIGERSSYDYVTYNGGIYYKVPIRNFDTSKYLTPEVVEWLETYMILPSIERDAE